MLLIALMFVFATFGVHLLGGKLGRCNDPAISVVSFQVFVLLIALMFAVCCLFTGICAADSPDVCVCHVWCSPTGRKTRPL